MLNVLQVFLRRQVWRSAASAAAGGAVRPPRGGARTCTVDPDLEEEFVFLDCTDPDDAHQHEKELRSHLSSSSSALASRINRPDSDPSLSPGLVAGVVPSPFSSSQKQLRSLEHQLQALKGGTLRGARPESLIQFHDVEFPLDKSIVSSESRKKKKREHRVVGSPDVDEPVSKTSCTGCGALLHCMDTGLPGYLPSEKFKSLQNEGGLGGATCQRCHLLTHHQQALSLQISRDQYRDVVSSIRPHHALVLLIVDLLDLPDSIVPDLPALVGSNKQVVVLGNKVDLLPADAPNYLQRLKRQLAQYCQDAGLGPQVTNIHLISAKTGYGVEGLISSLQRTWRYSGDVYLVGTANVGKSTLFNTLLQSDYCKSRASDTLSKATISPWPGTTLNLLKFPIINPTPYRMWRREERLQEEPSEEELERLQHFSRQGYLVGSVGRTFRSNESRTDEIEFDPDSLAFGEDNDGETRRPSAGGRVVEELSHNEVKDARWLYDTPGIMKEFDVLGILSDKEVRLVVPSQAIFPRTFVLKPETSLFVGGLFRIDYLQGRTSSWFSVMASRDVPIHISSLQKADAVYQKHAGHTLLGVPLGGSERMKDFPALVPQVYQLKGRGYSEAAADITLSSAGWVAVTAVEGDEVQLRVSGPPGSGFGLRTPPLLPHVVTLKGQRIRKTSAYKPLKTVVRLKEQLQLNKKKKKK